MSDVAYVARYGHQQRREIYCMTPAELRRWVSALSAIVEQEQKGA